MSYISPVRLKRKTSSESPTTRVFSYRVCITGIILSLVSVLSVADTSFAASHRATNRLSLLQQGMNYYKGKTLTFITTGATGSGSDLNARYLAPVIASYLGATVNIENYSTGNTIPGQDALASSPHNGLTFGQLTMATDISIAATHTPGLNFNPIRLDFIGAGKSSPYVWISAPSSPYSSWETIEKATTPTKMLDTLSGSGSLVEGVVNGIFGLKVNLIAGYSSSTTLLAGFLRGDGPVTEANLTLTAPDILAGVARPILVTNKVRLTPKLSAALAGVPTLAKIAEQYPPKTKVAMKALTALEGILAVNIVTALPINTPKTDVLALQAAFKHAALDSSLFAAELSAGEVPGWVSAADAKSDWTSVAKKVNILSPYLVGG